MMENGGVAVDHFQLSNGHHYSRASPVRNGHSSNGYRDASPGRRERCSQSPNRSIVRVVDGKRAKKVRFYRNGDRFFQGIIFAVSPERFRTFESLLVSLTSSPLCDKNVLPNGVRHIFSIDGAKKITSLDDLSDEDCYVCASSEMFKRVQYGRSANVWSPNITARTDPVLYQQQGPDDEKNFIYPKLVTVIRNGTKPRKAVRILLNKKTAHSFNQVLTDITNAIKLDSGSVKKIFTIAGQQICSLQDFFGEESIFLAYGHERTAADDFDLDEKEVRVVSAFRSTGQPKERVTLGSKSPVSPRRQLHSSSKSLNDVGLNLTRSAPNTPRLIRKPKPKSPLASPSKSPLGSPLKSPGKSKHNGHLPPNGKATSPLSLPPIISTRYLVGNLIGEGNFAAVHSCTERETQRLYALKIIDKKKCRGKENMIENEVSILREVQHHNIVALIEDFETDTEMFLIMEYVKGGDLFDAISSATSYSERDASCMIRDVTSALAYLHQYNICHRDVKCENILVSESADGSKSLKLGDFGLAVRMMGEPLTVVCGSPAYVAPEILKENGYGLEVDVWATGVISYILLCGFAPFGRPSDKNDVLFKKIILGHVDFTSSYWDVISDSAKTLISHMLDVDPASRYTAQQVLDHPWISADAATTDRIEITSTLNVNFERRRKGNPGIAVIASTALDKQAKFFSLTDDQEGEEEGVLSYANGHDEETF